MKSSSNAQEPHRATLSSTDQSPQSSTMSQMKRRESIMGEVSGEKTRVLKTYRSKTTLDGLDYRGINGQEGWDTPRTKKRRLNTDGLTRVGSLPASSPLSLDAAKPGMGVQNDLDIDRDEVYKGSNTDGESTNTTFLQARQPQREIRASMCSQSSMLPPASKGTSFGQPEDQYSEGSTVPNTPIEFAQSTEVANATSGGMAATSSDRITTPTISAKSSGKQEDASIIDDVGGEIGEESISGKYDLRPPSSASEDVGQGEPPSADPNQNSTDYQVTPIYSSRLEKDVDDQDELALLSCKSAETCDQVPISKVTSKRKVIDDDVSSPDSAPVDLPPERYQPRPSRSRSNRAVDDLVLSIDYSKRPEGLAKGKRKAKRSKTTGDDDVVIDLEASRESISRETPRKDTALASRTEESGASNTKLSVPIVEVPTLVPVASPKNAIDETTVELHEPKRRRGRPKKQTLTDTEDNVAEMPTSESVAGVPVISILDDEKPEPEPEPVPPPPIKKGRKRQKSKEEPLGAETESFNKDTLSQSHNHPKGTIENIHPETDLRSSSNLAENLNKADINMIKQAPEEKPGSTLDDVREACELNPIPSESISLLEIEVPQTPKEKENQIPRGDGSVGKIRYRIGLSKKAYIPPLLKVFKR